MPTRKTETVETVIERAVRILASRRLPSPKDCRTLREAAGVSQAQLAREVWVGQPALCRWESGQRSPRHAAAWRYLVALKRWAATLSGPGGRSSILSRPCPR